MYTIPPKKMIIINILDILKKYSDMDHRLTQADIMEKLKKEYYMDVDRKTVKRNLMNLLDLDCGIEYTDRSIWRNIFICFQARAFGQSLWRKIILLIK